MIEEYKIGTIGYAWNYDGDYREPCILINIADKKTHPYNVLIFDCSYSYILHLMKFEPCKPTKEHEPLLKWLKEFKDGLTQDEK